MLSSFIAKLLLARQFSINEREIRILGRGFYLQPLRQLAVLQHSLLERFGEDGLRIIYEAGKASFMELSKEMERFSADRSKFLEVIMNFIKHFGLGDAQLIKMDEKGCKARVEARENPFAKEYLKLFGVQRRCIDSLLAGVLSGFFSVFFKKLSARRRAA
jgi:hypothetical protein